MSRLRRWVLVGALLGLYTAAVAPEGEPPPPAADVPISGVVEHAPLYAPPLPRARSWQ